VTQPDHLPFNRPYASGREFQYIREAIEQRHLSGDGAFTRRCHAWLEARFGCTRALLTHSCTAALDMIGILAGIEVNDEVIMPSFTFVSTANAFVLRGGVPVFVDIREDTFNIDERLIEDAITERTKAVAVVHYAGVACDMDAISRICERHGLLLIEDAAQALMSSYRGRPLGSFGAFSALSFHETKNVIAGEGGALLINDQRWVDRAEIVREKGTNRSQFFRGHVDKYTWVDIGSSFLPSEITAAFLWAQLEEAEALTRHRRRVWDLYHAHCERLEAKGLLRRPIIPADAEPNGHMYPVLAADLAQRTRLLQALATRGVNAVFHYVPLHSSPAGRKYGRTHGDLVRTDEVSERLLRLPLWVGMTEDDVARVVEAIAGALGA
jgi:dTDP-4-amino-4,6-dideoxygalactose transaminase